MVAKREGCMPSKRDQERQREKAWKYVGRFMWSFAYVESSIDAIIEIMFNLNAVSMLLLQSRLPLREKVELVKLGLKRQGHLVAIRFWLESPSPAVPVCPPHDVPDTA
jgi:hypothetical protein